MVLVDTPGIFQPRRRLDRAMVQAAWGGAQGADLIALVVDGKAGLGAKMEPIVGALAARPDTKWMILNKVDIAIKEKKIGRASSRERACQYVKITVVEVSLQKKQTNINTT